MTFSRTPFGQAYLAAQTLAPAGWSGNSWARPAEEADLLETFGAEYSACREQVRCWLPRRQPYRQNERASRSSWKSHL